MYRIVEGTTHDLPDAARFLERLKTEGPAFFAPGRELFAARAPGRLDLMGGIADYSGALVLQWPLAEATFAAVQRDPDRRLRILSLGGPASFEMPLTELESGRAAGYESARAFFAGSQPWAAYVAGAFLVLRRECGAEFPEGARVLIASEVPQGRGVSSSAALEVASMRAVAAAFDIRIEPREMALLCQKVENSVAGAPCGAMDQMTAACGRAGSLLALLCRPAELEDFVALPGDFAVWGLDSGVSHSVSGSDYGSVRVGAFMGRRILAAAWRREVRHLTELPPSDFEQFYRARLPERINGAEFLRRYGETGDQATSVDPARDYAVLVPAAHPVHEHFRVQMFRSLLDCPGAGELLGELMYQSHASYSACGLGSGGTDLLVSLVRSAGPASGLYGAKITGGGSGGTVAVLGRRGADRAVEAVAAEYAARTGQHPYVFRGSSPGAADFGYWRLESTWRSW